MQARRISRAAWSISRRLRSLRSLAGRAFSYARNAPRSMGAIQMLGHQVARADQAEAALLEIGDGTRPSARRPPASRKAGTPGTAGWAAGQRLRQRLQPLGHGEALVDVDFAAFHVQLQDLRAARQLQRLGGGGGRGAWAPAARPPSFRRPADDGPAAPRAEPQPIELAVHAQAPPRARAPDAPMAGPDRGLQLLGENGVAAGDLLLQLRAAAEVGLPEAQPIGRRRPRPEPVAEQRQVRQALVQAQGRAEPDRRRGRSASVPSRRRRAVRGPSCCRRADHGAAGPPRAVGPRNGRAGG